jgi:hypothetical protein
MVFGVVSIVAIGVAGFLYFTKLELTPRANETASAETAPTPSPSSAPSPSPTSTPAAQGSPPPSPGPASIPSAEKFSAEDVPFVPQRTRVNLANEYTSGADYKALALTNLGSAGFVVGQPSEDAAENAALELCQKRSDSTGFGRRCEVYAVGNVMVYAHGKPPMPPTPWVRHDPSIERPFVAKEIPLVRDRGKERLEAAYVPGRKSRSVAVGPGGQFIFNVNLESAEESERRALESCGALAGVPCLILAADDVFVVPVPTLMKPIGFFKAANNPSILVAWGSRRTPSRTRSTMRSAIAPSGTATAM